MINVDVDATGLRPISESAIAALIDARPTSRSTADQQNPVR